MIVSRIIPILLVIGAIGLFVGYTQSTYSSSVAALKDEITNLDSALKAAEQFKLKEAQLTQQRNAMPAEQLARLESFLPDSVDNVQLIVDLNSLAARSGVQLSEFSIAGGATDSDTSSARTSAAPLAAAGPTTGPAAMSPQSNTLALQTSKPTESLELSVSATGSYAAFRTFLTGVEQSLRPLDVIELSVQDSDTGVYTYDMTFRLYWLR
ncbi:MAG: hypothetical protein QG636_240 [Patescibacteria group bacterium]|jgi:Tfp pilus assembly protein PilO|nr:hypothetical protein [Patescibacteria group bacterium]